MHIEIKEVKTRRDLDKFIQFPLKLYRNNRYYVPPLIMDEKNNLSASKNPVFDFCEAKYWLALVNGKVAGRIGSIINHRENKLSNEKMAHFNWFDLENSPEVGNVLLDTAESWAFSRGMSAIYGPYGFTNFDRHGILIEGSEELATSISNYNYPYYREIIENHGYEKKVDWVETRIKVPDKIPEKIERVARIALKRNELHLAEINSTSDINKYLQEFWNLLNKAYFDLSGGIPLDESQKEVMSKKFYKYLNPDFVSFVLNKEDKLVAFGISIPSLSRALQKAKGHLYPTGFFHLLKALRKNDTIDLMLIAVTPELQNKGVNSIFFLELIPNYIRHQIKYVETTQNLDDNIKVKSQWDYFDSRQHKRSRCYIKYFKNRP
jgi:hypothetical protein